MREASVRRTATDTDSYAFFVQHQMPTRGRPRQESFNMTIAKGRTNCEAERSTIAQGFHELLKVLKHAKNQTEVHAKAALYDIANNKSLSDEERCSQMRSFNEMLSNQEESDIRIRRTILIGLFSFWELSLKDLCEYYKITIIKAKNIIKEGKSKKCPNLNDNDYLNAIFPNGRPNNIGLISSQIKELRHYMTHGSANEDRQVIIDNLIEAHPDLCISKICDDYTISSYDGLNKMLQIINDSLMIAEMTAKTLNVQN